MTNPKIFDDIRPYYDSEVPAAMQHIAESEVFPLLASYVFPDEAVEDVRRRVAAYRNTREFQTDMMYKVNEQVIRRSMTSYTCDGLDQLDPREHYLFVSNHRDIMLDASLLQYSLVSAGFDTTEITFGANLMQDPVVVDVGKSNKMFKVERPGGNIRDFYHASRHLSDYIRYCIREKGQSAWIAQRNGRTKDGSDHTDQGIIKMFCMSKPEDKIAAIADLHIVPVSISYEWESCDILKALERYKSQFAKYTKKPGEDLNSILTGILQFKGHVHLQVCEPLHRAELETFEGQTNNEYHRSVAQLLDRRIIRGYRLYPNNYIAHDMLFGATRYRGHYTVEEEQRFAARVKRLERYDTCELDTLRELFLAIYANPINEKEKL